MENWQVHHLSGSAESIHGRDLPAVRAVWRASVNEPAIVLGSKQSFDIVNQHACDLDGVSVVKRRSGGGAVYLEVGEHLWIDLVIGRSDELWHDDVGRATWWVGELWADVLAQNDVAERDELVVHHGGLERSGLSDLVCFAGLGPGEVTLHGEKLVGISQRRTRDMARFQCVLHRRWSPESYTKYLNFTEPFGRNESMRLDLNLVVASVAGGLEALADGLIAQLTTSV